jgi:hypothetical protein
MIGQSVLKHLRMSGKSGPWNLMSSALVMPKSWGWSRSLLASFRAAAFELRAGASMWFAW